MSLNQSVVNHHSIVLYSYCRTTIVPIVFRVAKSDLVKNGHFLGDNVPSSSSWDNSGSNNSKTKTSYDLVVPPVLVDLPKSIACDKLYNPHRSICSFSVSLFTSLRQE